MIKNYELEENKRKIRVEIGYGFMWVFVMVLLEGIPFSIGLGSLIYHPLAVLAGFGAVYKFRKGIKRYKKFGVKNFPGFNSLNILIQCSFLELI